MKNFTEVADNSIVINGVEFKVVDSIAEQIIALCTSEKQSLTAPIAEKTVSEKVVEKTTNKAESVLPNDVKCKWSVEEILIGGKKFYRILDGIFTFGKWYDSKFNPGEEYRIPVNQEAHRIATTKIKGIKGIKGVETEGGWIAYGFSSKKSAEKALEALPTHIQGVEIAEYIGKYGAIKAKAVKRTKKSA